MWRTECCTMLRHENVKQTRGENIKQYKVRDKMALSTNTRRVVCIGTSECGAGTNRPECVTLSPTPLISRPMPNIINQCTPYSIFCFVNNYSLTENNTLILYANTRKITKQYTNNSSLSKKLAWIWYLYW